MARGSREAQLEQQVRTLTARLAAADKALAAAGVDTETAHRTALNCRHALRTVEVQAFDRFQTAGALAGQMRDGIAGMRRLLDQASGAVDHLATAAHPPVVVVPPEPAVLQLLGERLQATLAERDELRERLTRLEQTSAAATLALKEARAGRGIVPKWLGKFVGSVQPGQDLGTEVLLALAARTMNWAWELAGDPTRIRLDNKPRPAEPVVAEAAPEVEVAP